MNNKKCKCGLDGDPQTMESTRCPKHGNNSYIKTQFERLQLKKLSTFNPSIHITTTYGHTNYINVSKKQLEQIKQILLQTE